MTTRMLNIAVMAVLSVSNMVTASNNSFAQSPPASTEVHPIGQYAMPPAEDYIATMPAGILRQPEGLCIKACDGDRSPCDPWVFKHADGRCAG